MFRSPINHYLTHRPSSFAPVNRRDFLRVGLAAAGGLLSGSFAKAANHQRGRRVVVVGAGFAGLACAYELMSVGYDVRVLEARKRVGGRVLSLRDLIPGKVVEGGGEMLGTNHPHVAAYIHKFQLKIRSRPVNNEKYDIVIGGHRLSDAEVQAVSEEVGRGEIQMTDQARAVNEDEPWTTPDAATLDRLSTAEWIASLGLSELASKYIQAHFEGENGVIISKQSHLGNLTQVKGGGLERYWIETEAFRLADGNQQFALSFAKELGSDRIKFDCPVARIDTTKPLMVVVDAAGQKYEADDVVLATPPSTWSSIEFTPSLPEQLTLQMGANLKFLAVVKEPFWQANSLPSSVESDAEFNAVWHGTEGQSSAGHCSLVGFSGGRGAEAIHQRKADEQQAANLKSMELLLPGVTNQFASGRLMDWIADPWTKSGYSFPAPGQITRVGPLLKQGIGNLHFAGEHTCLKFVGYMEGALNSGATLAIRLAKRDGII